jgi:hypothetical protein
MPRRFLYLYSSASGLYLRQRNNDRHRRSKIAAHFVAIVFFPTARLQHFANLLLTLRKLALAFEITQLFSAWWTVSL